MSLKKNCVVLAAAVLTAVAVFSPSACQAGLFDCFSSSSAPAPTSYAPPSPYQVQMPTCNPCNPCAAPQVNYVPEVKYRWKYSRIARTEYQPIASADPCSGCPVTSYRPVTKKSMLPWLHREAYTTYKAVPYGGATPVNYMQPSYQSGCCNPCGTTCDPCGGSSSMAAPSLNSGCSTCVAGNPDSGYPEQTFQSGGSDWGPVEDSNTQMRNKPIPDPETQKTDETTNSQPTSMPKMVIPQLQTDRTASLNRVRTISYEAPALMTASGNLRQAAATAVMPLRLVPIE